MICLKYVFSGQLLGLGGWAARGCQDHPSPAHDPGRAARIDFFAVTINSGFKEKENASLVSAGYLRENFLSQRKWIDSTRLSSNIISCSTLNIIISGWPDRPPGRRPPLARPLQQGQEGPSQLQGALPGTEEPGGEVGEGPLVSRRGRSCTILATMDGRTVAPSSLVKGTTVRPTIVLMIVDESTLAVDRYKCSM